MVLGLPTGEVRLLDAHTAWAAASALEKARIIDDQASVCVAPLERIGYRYRHEHGIPRRHHFVQGDPRTHHLHMVERDSHHWVMTVTFREFLNRDSDSARAYAEAKRSLAAEYSRDREAYQRETDQVVERLLALAADTP